MIPEERLIHWCTWFASLDVWQALHSPLIPLFLGGRMSEVSQRSWGVLPLIPFPSPCHGWGRLYTVCAQTVRSQPLIHTRTRYDLRFFIFVFKGQNSHPPHSQPPIVTPSVKGGTVDWLVSERIEILWSSRHVHLWDVWQWRGQEWPLAKPSKDWTRCWKTW
jgi:hypothetical protein